MILQAKYKATVWVEVDTDTGEILSVNVDDESLEAMGDVIDRDQETVDDHTIDEVYDIIDDYDGLWPVWEVS